MKKSLIALTLITLAVSACGKKEEPAVILPPPASTPSLNTTDNPPPAPAAAGTGRRNPTGYRYHHRAFGRHPGPYHRQQVTHQFFLRIA